MCLAYAKLYGMEVVCLRYFNVYGPNQRFDAYGNVIPIFAYRILTGEPMTIFGDGEQTRDFVNVADVVQANLGGRCQGVSGAFNIGSGKRITINDLVETLRRRCRNGSSTSPDPRPFDVRDSLADIAAASPPSDSTRRSIWLRASGNIRNGRGRNMPPPPRPAGREPAGRR